MSIDAAQQAAAGWYADPGGSGQLRWWDGATWTAHLRSAEAPPVAPAYNPAVAQPTGWSEQSTEFVLPHNGIAWTAFVFGIAAFVLALTGIIVRSWGWVIILAGPVAIILAIVALVRSRSGRVNNRWAPIVGIVLGALGTIIMALGLLFVGLAQTVNSAEFPGVKASSSVTPVTFRGNAELSSVNALTYQLEEHLAVPAQNGLYPTTLGFDAASGTVSLPDGTAIATLPLGWTIHYQPILGGREYQLAVTGLKKGEYVVYQSTSRTLDTYCAAGDTTCVP